MNKKHSTKYAVFCSPVGKEEFLRCVCCETNKLDCAIEEFYENRISSPNCVVKMTDHTGKLVLTNKRHL